MRTRHCQVCACLILILHLTTSSVSVVKAQTLGDELKRQLADARTIPEIMAVVEPFYAGLTDEQRNNGADGLIKYKHWKRWEWYMARHHGPNGEIVNINARNKQLIEEARRTRSLSRQPIIEGDWEFIGANDCNLSPDTSVSAGNGVGRVDRIAFHPSDSSIYYVGTPNGGLWKTEDDGTTWEPLTDTLASVGISGIVVTPSNPDRIIVLTGTGDDILDSYYRFMGTGLSLGLMESLDGGETWELKDTFPYISSDSIKGYALAQAPDHPDTLVAATSNGLYITTDGGDSYTHKFPGTKFYDVVFKPSSNESIYSATADKIYYSTDGGANWTQSVFNTPPSISPKRIALGVTPADSSIVYAFLGNDGLLGNFAGVYLSTNSGMNFRKKGTTPNILGYAANGLDAYAGATYNHCIDVDPEDSKRLILGGFNTWYSIDSGATFKLNTYNNEGWNLPYVHTDIHAVKWNPHNHAAYICGDGGIWKQAELGDTCIFKSKGLAVTQFYHISRSRDYGHCIAGGTQDNGVRFRTIGTDVFTMAIGGDGFSSSWATNNRNKLYMTGNSGSARTNLVTGHSVSLGTTDNMFFKNILTHPTDSNLIFIGGRDIFRSTNQGVSFVNKGASGSWEIVISPSNPNHMMSAGGNNWYLDPSGGLFRSVDTGNSWEDITSKPGMPDTFGIITGISYDALDSLTVYFTVGGYLDTNKVYRTIDGGNTWMNISHNLPNTCILSIVATSEGVFIGTGFTVYHLAIGGNSWTDVGSNIPHSGVIDLLYEEDTGKLTAGTFGRGIWQRQVCIPDITLTDTLPGNLKFSCSDELMSSSTIVGQPVDSIQFKADGNIKLIPGFKVGTGGYFKASLEACDQGNIPLPPPPPVGEPNLPVPISTNRKD